MQLCAKPWERSLLSPTFEVLLPFQKNNLYHGSGHSGRWRRLLLLMRQAKEPLPTLQDTTPISPSPQPPPCLWFWLALTQTVPITGDNNGESNTDEWKNRNLLKPCGLGCRWASPMTTYGAFDKLQIYASVSLSVNWGLSQWLRGKRICLQCRKLAEDAGSIPWSGRALGGGHGNPLQYSCLENSMDWGAQHGYSPWGHQESVMAEWHKNINNNLSRRVFVCKEQKKSWM